MTSSTQPPDTATPTVLPSFFGQELCDFLNEHPVKRLEDGSYWVVTPLLDTHNDYICVQISTTKDDKIKIVWEDDGDDPMVEPNAWLKHRCFVDRIERYGCRFTVKCEPKDLLFQFFHLASLAVSIDNIRRHNRMADGGNERTIDIANTKELASASLFDRLVAKLCVKLIRAASSTYISIRLRAENRGGK